MILHSSTSLLNQVAPNISLRCSQMWTRRNLFNHSSFLFLSQCGIKLLFKIETCPVAFMFLLVKIKTKQQSCNPELQRCWILVQHEALLAISFNSTVSTKTFSFCLSSQCYRDMPNHRSCVVGGNFLCKGLRLDIESSQGINTQYQYLTVIRFKFFSPLHFVIYVYKE